MTSVDTREEHPTAAQPMTRPYDPVRDGFRAAGHYLDAVARRMTSLVQIRDGIVLVMGDPDERVGGEAVMLTHDDLAALAIESFYARGTGSVPSSADPLFPTGYEDFLRALADTVAAEAWSWLRLVRVGEGALVRHGRAGKRRGVPIGERTVFDTLNTAFQRRAPGQATPPRQPNATSVPLTLPPADGDDSDARPSYADALGAIGTQLERLGATDLHLAELAGGFALCYMSPHGEQCVTTLASGELAGIIGRGGRSRAHRRRSLHGVLGEIGRYLDERRTVTVVLQEDAVGYHVEYTTWRDRRDDLPGISRVHERLPYAELVRR